VLAQVFDVFKRSKDWGVDLTFFAEQKSEYRKKNGFVTSLGGEELQPSWVSSFQD